MYDFEDLKGAGIDVDAGMEFTGRDDKYLSAIQRFYKAYEGNVSKLSEFLKENDLNNYSITIHAVKSNAKMIGANEVSEIALKLEMASKDGDAQLVASLHENFMAMYDKLMGILKSYGEMERVKAPGELDGDEARGIARELLEALDDFDDDKSSELAEKMLGYPFRITQKQLLKEAIDAIDNFMYDDAAEIINTLINYIE